jgi:DNA invertase Pin-like site-specific DNA recombinase
MNAIGYATHLEGHSVRRQQNSIRASFARIYRIRWYSDHGSSDESARPKLAELVAHAVAENVNSVLIENFRCLAKRPELRAAIAGVIRGFGLTIEPAQRDRIEEQGIAEAMAATVSGIVEALTARGLLVGRSGRRQPGPKPYGMAEGRERASHERQVREEILRLSAAGWGVGRIAKKLNADGERTRRGCLWYPQSVARVLNA